MVAALRLVEIAGVEALGIRGLLSTRKGFGEREAPVHITK